MTTEQISEADSTISPQTRLGHVHLTVANLDDQSTFYQNVLGMHLHWREGESAGLGVGEDDLLRLTEAPGARRVHGATGLYHFALHYPNRRELARAVARLFELRYPNHPTDHVISETTYLDDPEGQNIELYFQTPHRGAIVETNDGHAVRRFDGKPASGRDPLDLDDLFQELSSQESLDGPLLGGTTMGHVHLYVANLVDSMHFYSDVLGFTSGLMSSSFRMGEVNQPETQTHIVAFNTWRGENAPPPPPDSLGIRYFSLVLPNQAELDRVLHRVQQDGIAMEEVEEGILVRDPSSIGVVLTT